MYKYVKITNIFMKSRSNKVDKQIVETIIVIKTKLTFTGNGYRPVLTETKLQIDRKRI